VISRNIYRGGAGGVLHNNCTHLFSFLEIACDSLRLSIVEIEVVIIKEITLQ